MMRRTLVVLGLLGLLACAASQDAAPRLVTQPIDADHFGGGAQGPERLSGYFKLDRCGQRPRRRGAAHMSRLCLDWGDAQRDRDLGVPVATRDLP